MHGQHPHDVTPTGAPEPAETADPAESAVIHMLQDGVPLSLLVDLGTPTGPDSAAILDAEGGPESEWWQQS